MPLVFFRETNVNYQDHPSFGLHTAVGTSDPKSGEGINVIPAVIGASLVGINKSNQFGQNWALMCEEYFNKRREENIYLNHPVTSSGDDWWYETMPNVFFLQLSDLYPHLGAFDAQIETLANQWLRATELMGGSATPWNVPKMNYRAWSMSTMTPLENGVLEPESAGAIAWILYHAYIITGKRKYLTGAEWSLEYLNSYTGNPSYELQLPYGVYAAARINAEIGTDYDIEKMVNWCFNRGELRDWGAIVGKWGAYDCSGLIGEANDEGNDYAFAMNGFEHAGALVPMVRYDDRFATAIAKWVLNLANASRLFYSDYLPDDMQDNENWARNFDPDSYIAYESMKETKYGKSPYATGDAMDGGWAATNLMLYSSSHVGILGGIIDTTNIKGVLKLDLLKTDYYKKDACPTYLYYNPYELSKSVGLSLPPGSYDLYDAISNAMVRSGISGNTNITIAAKQAVMLVQIPAGTSITYQGKKTYAGDIIIDFNNGNTVPDFPPRMKALAAADSLFVVNTAPKIYCTASDPEQEKLRYEWTIEGTTYDSSEVFQYTSSALPGRYKIECKVSDPGGQWDTLSINIVVVDKIMLYPEIIKIEAIPRKVHLSGSISLNCLAQDANQDALSYEWTSMYGDIVADGFSASYTASGNPGNDYIVCSVSDVDGMTAVDSIEIMVRDLSVTPSGHLIAHYPMNGNARDASGNALHGTTGGVFWVNDKEGTASGAAHFNGTTDYIHVTNNDLLNFQDALSIACWINIDAFSGSEQYPISHGNWDKRYKISISNNKIRFTLNTSTSIKDLDSETSPIPGQWHHLATVYDGNDMEIWMDGALDAFTSFSGLINKTSFDLAFGQYLPGENGYNFNGSLDAVSFFDYAITAEQILDHLEHSTDITSAPEIMVTNKKMKVFPNPVHGQTIHINIQYAQPEQISLELYDITGKQTALKCGFSSSIGESAFTIPVGMLGNGIYLLSVTYNDIMEKELVIISR
ncbi:MAG: LamG-like jellyroll fold domain-containing protein [Bacteroidota bacterium]